MLLKNDGGTLPLAKTIRVDRRDRHRRGRSATRRVQRPGHSQGLDSRRHHATIASGAGYGARVATRRDPAGSRAKYVVVPQRRALVQRQRPHRARPARRVLRQQSPRWTARGSCEPTQRVDFGWTLNSPGARHSVRLVLGAVDGTYHRSRERRAASSASRATMATGLYLDGKLADRQLAEACRTARAWRT